MSLPPASSRKEEHRLLFFAFIFGNLSLLATIIGLFISGDYTLSWNFSWQVVDGGSALLLDAIRSLLLDPPVYNEINGWLIAGRIFSIIFAATGVTGIILEISQVASDQLLKFRYRLMQLFNKSPAVVVGAGTIGAGLAGEIREQARPVYLFTGDTEPDSLQLKELRKSGILVIAGSFIDHLANNKKGNYLEKASEIYLTLQDDSRNLEIAGEIIERMPEPSGKEITRNGYVHIGDPELTKTIRDHHILGDHQKDIHFHLFSVTSATAMSLSLQLFLDQGLGLLSELSAHKKNDHHDLPLHIQQDEVFHLFLFGFGKTAQAIALNIARFAHFASGVRPRITIFGDPENGTQPWVSFLEKYPAFAPIGLDLTGEEFKKSGDGWDHSPARPIDHDYRTRDLYPEGRTVVEYAVHAEYLPVLNEINAGSLVGTVQNRLDQGDTGIQAAVVIADDNERQNFHNALRFQKKMAGLLMDDQPENATNQPCRVKEKFWNNLCPLPIFSYIPTDTGLAHILNNGSYKDEWAVINRQLPTHAFGQISELISYDSITRGNLKQMAKQIREVYKILSQKNEVRHVDFSGSDMDSILFTEVKLQALGITFSSKKGKGEKPLFDEYFDTKVEDVFKKWKSQGDIEHGTLWIQPRDLERIMDEDNRSAERLLAERMALMGRMRLSQENKVEPEAQKLFKKLKKKAVVNVLDRFTRDYEKRKIESSINNEYRPKADLAAEMEHNRWMGERLAKNWRYGPEKSNFNNERSTFVPWKELTEEERFYDRQQVPRIIMAQYETGQYAYVH
mgnify:FL=1